MTASDARSPFRPAPHAIRQPARVEIRIDRHVVAESFRRRQDRLELDLLYGTLAPCAAPLRVADHREDLVVVERRERGGHFRLALDEGEAGGIVDDLQVVPEFPHDGLDRRAPFRDGQHAQHLREPGVGRRAHQESARLVALLVRVAPEPRPRAAAGAERVDLDHARVGQAARRTALAAHHQVRQVSGRPLLVEPQRAGRRALATATMDESAPIEIVDVPARTSADETRGHHVPALEAALVVVECLPMHETPRPCVRRALSGVRRLDDEPLRKAPRTDPDRRRAGIGRHRRRRQQLHRGDAGDRLQLPREPRLVDLVQLVRRRPFVESRDDRRLLRQVDEGARAVGGDDLAAANLAVRLLLHAPPDCRGARRSCR